MSRNSSGSSRYERGCPARLDAGRPEYAIAYQIETEAVEPVHDARRPDANAVLNSFRKLPTEHHRPLILLAIVVFRYMMGFHPIEAFFSSYGVNVLGLSESDIGFVLATAYITFILFAIPSGMIAGKIGRRRTMQTGLVLFTIVMSVAFFTPITTIMVVLMGLGGLAWALMHLLSSHDRGGDMSGLRGTVGH